MKIINKDTLEISTDRAVLAEIKKTVSVGPNTLAERGWQPILAAPKPASSTNLKIVTSNGATQDANGNWVDAYIERDMFATDDDSTKAEKEAAYTAKLLDDRRQILIDSAKKLRSEAFYTNAVVAFPTDNETLHFRDEIDRSNIRDKGFKAFTNVAAGNGSTTITFKPVGKAKITMTSLQLLTALETVANEKDVVWNNYGGVIQQIKDATTSASLDAAETALNAL